jgi:hypothetical protein
MMVVLIPIFALSCSTLLPSAGKFIMSDRRGSDMRSNMHRINATLSALDATDATAGIATGSGSGTGSGSASLGPSAAHQSASGSGASAAYGKDARAARGGAAAFVSSSAISAADRARVVDLFKSLDRQGSGSGAGS